MPVRILTSPDDLARYDRWVKEHPHGSLWQSVEWKTYQEALGRTVRVYAEEESGRIVSSALVTIDRTAFGLSTWDCARGPLGSGRVLEKVLADARCDRCLSLYLSGRDMPHLPGAVIAPSSRCEQLEATIIMDLTLSDDALLAQMHPKGRYNIKVAQKHGVEIREHRPQDTPALEALYGLLRATGSRDGFGILPERHYRAFLERLSRSFCLMAWHDKKPVAGLLGVLWNGTGIYYYGASDHAHRALMAPALLQWEAMRLCKERGCRSYDLLGISPTAKDGSPARSREHDPWAGITDFKRKLGGTVVTYQPEQEIVLRPTAKILLSWKRRVIG